ncbi:hypothetical protein N9B94_01225 [Verrucomicrobia bacterium]|nr:hypothetical protein [Verrucomicrobiota bacterium]
MKVHSFLTGFLLILFSTSANADQPIFNEMPRWDEGWGFQFIEEYRTESDLLQGRQKVAPGFSEDIHILHFQGVYTWDRSIRMTFKLPYVLDAQRDMLVGGTKQRQHDSGIGDATIALPLKKYFNLDGRSGSWTLAPQLRVPLDDMDSYEVYDHKWGSGIGLSYETETYRYHFGTGATAWVFQGGEPAEIHTHLDLGLNVQAFGSSGHIKWESDVQYEADGSLTFMAGPTLYWKITDTVHTQIRWKHDFFDRQGTLDHGNGDQVMLGLGFVF